MTTAAIPLTLQAGSEELETRLRPVFELLDEISEKENLSPGVLAIGYHGKESIHLFGRRPSAEEVVECSSCPVVTLFDWAILKHALLVSGIAHLVEFKQLALETPVSSILQGTALAPPEGGWRGVTVRQVLEHTSGLILDLSGAKTMSEAHMRFVPPGQPNDTFPYTDAVIEEWIVSTLTGKQGLASADAMVLARLRPLSFPAMDSPLRLGPDRPKWEAEDDLVLGELWLNDGIYAHRRIFSRKTASTFLAARTEADSTFTAGWQVSLAPGHKFSGRSFGFTVSEGPSLWMDPEHELCIVFLPATGAAPLDERPPGDRRIGPLRAQVHDAIFSALGLSNSK